MREFIAMQGWEMIAILLLLALQANTLSDEALVRYAASRFDQAEKMHKREVLGVHHGATVIAEYPCADFCPNYTIRVIRYDLAPGMSCAGIGGVFTNIRVPDGFGAGDRAYCVPKILDWQRGFSGD